MPSNDLKGRAGCVLTGAVKRGVGGTSRVGETLHGTIQSEVRGVTIAAEVTENDMLQRGLKLGQNSSGGGVRKMPVAGEDPLLD